ncbi:arginine--tRNA ligase, chloroplastic/mitochondrial, partial [Tanacetum coccineum]
FTRALFTSTMTIHASIIESSLEIVNMLRRYEFEASTSLTIAATSPQDGVRMRKFMNMLRSDEFFSMMEAFTSTKALPSPQDEDRMWSSLRKVNMLKRGEFFSRMEDFTSTMPLTIAPDEEDNKWRLQTDVLNLFNKALGDTFPEFKEKCTMLWLPKDGDFQCKSYQDIKGPEIKKSKSYRNIKGPKDVGERIKKGLMKLKSHTIEGEPCVYGVGFVTIKLSGNWMAENIHKMLRDGIDTWAPRQQLDFKSTIVNSPSWDKSNLMPMDVLRRQFIIMSRMHMLEYVKSAATTSSGNGMSLPPGELDEHFRTVEKDEEMLIYVKDEGNTKPIIHGKSRGKSLKERDGCFGYPLEDLGALWHGLVSEKADWIVCVTPTQQQDYVENCFSAAQHAGWRSPQSCIITAVQL